jgi:hypothetical protein
MKGRLFTPPARLTKHGQIKVVVRGTGSRQTAGLNSFVMECGLLAFTD